MSSPTIVDAPGLRAAFSVRPQWREPFLRETLPALTEAAHRASVALTKPPLRQGEGGEMSLERTAVRDLLAGLFLGTLAAPERDDSFPRVSFEAWRELTSPQTVTKMLCLLAYFQKTLAEPPSGSLRISRRILDSIPTHRFWAGSDAPLAPFEIRKGPMEAADGCLQADFANRYLGGAVLGAGCAQEEIRFSVSPELISAMLFSPVLLDHEAIVIDGSQRYSETTGYGYDLRFARALNVPGPPARVVAFDAIPFDRRDLAPQLVPKTLLREVNKAYCAFLSADGRVATGNWGCGVFGGDPQLKSLVQWVAASVAGVAVWYFPYGDERVASLGEIAGALRARGLTAGDLWRRLTNLSSHRGVFEQIAQSR